MFSLIDGYINSFMQTILRNLQQLIETTTAAVTASTATTPAKDQKTCQKVDEEPTNPPPPPYKSGLHHLMDGTDENGSPISHSQILELVTGLMLGAVDTTATVLLLALRRLTLYPAVLERAHREQVAVVSEHGSEWTEASLRSMKYLDAVLKETVRLQSPVQIVFRRTLQDLELGEYCIPAGMKLLCNVGEAIIGDARWVDNSNCKEFLPERWLEEDGARTGGWLPFGGGARLCPGQQLAWLEMKLLLGAVVRSYTVKLVEPDEKWSEFPLMTPLRGMPIDVRKRAV